MERALAEVIWRSNRIATRNSSFASNKLSTKSHGRRPAKVQDASSRTSSRTSPTSSSTALLRATSLPLSTRSRQRTSRPMTSRSSSTTPTSRRPKKDIKEFINEQLCIRRNGQTDFSGEMVEETKSLIARQGSLEFRIAANEADDKRGIAAARQHYSIPPTKPNWNRVPGAAWRRRRSRRKRMTPPGTRTPGSSWTRPNGSRWV